MGLQYKTIHVVPNEGGDGATALARDLVASLNRLQGVPINAIGLDSARGELWRQARLQNGFDAYPPDVFEDAYKHYVNKARHTMPEHNLSTLQHTRLREVLTDQTRELYIVIDSRSKEAIAAAKIVLLVARCDARNLATLRSTYQSLVNSNPNTYIVLTQGMDKGPVERIKNKLIQGITERRLQALSFNAKPLVIPFDEAYNLAAREGVPVFDLNLNGKADEASRQLRIINHEIAVEVRHNIIRAERRVFAADQSRRAVL